MRVLAKCVLVIGLFSPGLLGEDLRRFSNSDTFRFGTLFLISIEKSAMVPEKLCPFSTILYEITLNNRSSQGTGNLPASIEDPIPAGTQYISGSVSENAFFDSANNSVIWTGTLGGTGFPQSQTLSFRVRVDQGLVDGTLINNAAIGRVSVPGDIFLGQQVELPLTVNCFATSGPVTWTGGGNDDDFSNPDNWDPPVAPGLGHDAVIPEDIGAITISQSHEIRSLDLGTSSTLRIEGGSLTLREESKIDGLLVNGSGAPSSEASDTQGVAFGRLMIHGNVSGTGRITNLDQMSVSSASLDVELETDGDIEINGLVNLMKPSENRGSYSLDSGDSLHYQGSGHNLEMTLNGPLSGSSDAIFFFQQATTATVQIDSSASASVSGPVEVQGHLNVIISGAPAASSISSPQTSSDGSGSATWSGGSINLGDDSNLRNQGTMTLSEPGDGSPALTVQNGAEFTNAGTVAWAGGTILVEGNAQLVNEASGEFSGSGTIEGSAQNAGAFEVGGSIGGITVTGKYSQLATGELRMELASASSFDVLQVGTATGASASLDGTLSVSLIDGFAPAGGDSFLIVDGPTEGSFSNCTPFNLTCTGLPILAAELFWEVIHGSVRLNVAQPGADLELKKVVDKTSADVGETVTFTVTLENKGPETATKIQVRDPVPSQLTDIESSSGYNQATGIWTVLSLPRDTTAILTLTGELSSGGTFTNTAELIAVDQMDADSTPNNGDENEDDQASASVSVTKVADLDISKMADPDPVAPGRDLTYTLGVTNNGHSEATDVTVIDTLPDGVTFVSAAGAGWNCSEVAGTVTCTRDSLHSSESAPDIHLGVVVDPSTIGQVENTATVSANEEDNEQENNSQTISTTVAISPLYFAQFGDGEVASASLTQALGTSTVQLSSEFFLVNPDKTLEAGATIGVKGDDGVSLDNVDLNGVVLLQGEVDVTIPTCGMRILRTDGEGPLQAGSATVTSDQQLSGVVVFNSGIGAAGVGASPALPAFVAPMLKNAEINTGIAFQNPGNDPVLVTLELRDSDGELLGTGSITLAGMGHRALFVDEIGWTPEPGAIIDFTDFEGLVKATTFAGGVAATVIQTRPQEFVTMPVAAPRESGSLELLFAQFGDGEQSGVGVSSEVILINLSKTMSAQATITLKDDDGLPLSGADLDGQVLADGTHNVTIPASGMRVLSTDGEGPLQVGSATVTSDKPLAGVIVFNSSAGAAGVGSSRKLPGFAAPMLKSATTNTGIAVQNPGNDPLMISLQLRSVEGQLLATASITLTGMGHRSLFVDEIAWNPEPDVTLDFSNFEGLLKGASSQGPVAATVIQTRGEILFVTMPVSFSK